MNWFIYLIPMNYKYSHEVDELVSRLIHEYQMVGLTKYYAIFKMKNKYIGVWRGNRWYAYASTIKEMEKRDWGWASGDDIIEDRRPSRKTLVEFDELIKGYLSTNPEESAIIELLKD